MHAYDLPSLGAFVPWTIDPHAALPLQSLLDPRLSPISIPGPGAAVSACYALRKHSPHTLACTL